MSFAVHCGLPQFHPAPGTFLRQQPPPPPPPPRERNHFPAYTKPKKSLRNRARWRNNGRNGDGRNVRERENEQISFTHHTVKRLFLLSLGLTLFTGRKIVPNGPASPEMGSGKHDTLASTRGTAVLEVVLFPYTAAIAADVAVELNETGRH
ncbi:hypothetical protein GWI33_005814 [Rhynchophorus ferrugineus]|uniref:Uncharacterized protein n=1 Tax=Rhynchophorus ferrugineus TaxID=354439 RepID=A0A834IGW9_RHYFE|nr:hypothetical protein GWI33_005814 [Rhynchophorus ferrugineus]